MENKIIEKILTLQEKINKKMNDHVNSSMSPPELAEIKSKLFDVVEQGQFWLKQKNPKRFLYELENLHSWIKEETEDKDESS